MPQAAQSQDPIRGSGWRQRLRDILSSLYPAPLAAFMGMLFWCACAHTNFRFADEGFLWYGAQRVLAGEVPLLDFRSYDPARYYWIAAVMAALHSYGMVAVNLAAALVGAIGLWLTLRLLTRERPLSPWLFLPVTASFILWLGPRVHTFDITVSVLLVATLAWMIQDPSRIRCFVTGLTLGLIAIVRRDHGLYGALAEGAGLLFLVWPAKRAPFLSSFACWSAGVVAGYSPMLLAAGFLPGFWTHLWASIHVYFEMGATNVPVPRPWPWRVHVTGVPPLDVLRYLLHGSLLIGMPLFGLALVAQALRRVLKGQGMPAPLLLAAGLLTIPYAHHAYARAGIEHLTTAAFPMLIGLFLLVLRLPWLKAAVLSAVILLVTLVLVLPQQPLYQEWDDGDWVSAEVGPDTLTISPQVALRVDTVQKLVARYAPAGQELAAMPMLCGAYAVTGRRAAVWNTYAVMPADPEVQQAEIARLRSERPPLVIIERLGREEGPLRGYPRTDPLVYDFILQNYVPVHPDFMPPDLRWDVYVPSGTTR